MLHHIVEGEPGIFPQPVADVLRRVGRWAERLTTRRRDRPDDGPDAEDER